MQTTCWRIVGLSMLFVLLIRSGFPLQASVLQSGIHDMVWGNRAADYPRLEKVRAAGDVSYYVDRQMVYQTAGQPVTGVIYGFYRDQLFAAYIKLRSSNQAYYLEKHFSGAYGPAKITSAGSGAQTTYRWEDGDLKVKLKVNEASGEIKLGIYYQPLSNKLNQTLAEEGPSDDISPIPPEDQSAATRPLL